jgi:RimJ/RimL family protein N-acetyltransferase
MIVLKKEEYGKVRHLVKSQNELSVFSVLDGEMPGEVKVNSAENPDVVLIKTSETTLIAGSVTHEDFNKEFSEMLDFWDSVTPDWDEWRVKIPAIHPNQFIKEYTRYKYTLNNRDFIKADLSIPDGYVLEFVNLKEMRQKNYINADRVYDWVKAWESEERFEESGCGCYIRKDDKIVSWSISDCYASDRIAVGIHTDPEYRKMGFAKKVASAIVQQCFDKGYNKVEWLCVSTNAGSKAIAEGIGFKQENKYASFSSYPPIENLTDLDEDGWYEWGTHLEKASKEERERGELIWDSLYCFVKANAVEKTMTVINEMTEKGIDCNPQRLTGDIFLFQKEGLCSAFKTSLWHEFIGRRV